MWEIVTANSRRPFAVSMHVHMSEARNVTHNCPFLPRHAFGSRSAASSTGDEGAGVSVVESFRQRVEYGTAIESPAARPKQTQLKGNVTRIPRSFRAGITPTFGERGRAGSLGVFSNFRSRPLEEFPRRCLVTDKRPLCLFPDPICSAVKRKVFA